MNNNLLYASIDTDKDLSSILNRLSEDSLSDIIYESLNHKFRPFANRMPNLPYIIKQNMIEISNNYADSNIEIIEKELETYNIILNIICHYYNLSITTDVPDEHLYSLVYTLYQILVSEFTERILAFFSNYLNANQEALLNAIPEDKKIAVRSAYTKKMYSNTLVVGVYENMEYIIDMIAGLDIPFGKLIEFLSDTNTANFICSYISDVGDIYKTHYASYIYDKLSRTDMITCIKIRYMDMIKDKMNITASNNPYIV